MRWAGAAIDPADPTLPDGARGARRLTSQAPTELARRLAQIGVIAREDAPRLTPMLKPGQRLVSREGDLWRWDGFSVAANAPTGAARRLAGKNRLADIEAELEAARRDVEHKQQVVTAAQAEAVAAAAAETAVRNSRRALQHEARSPRAIAMPRPSARQAATRRGSPRSTRRRRV